MSDGYFVAGDWGTSSLRLHLCKKNTVIDSKSGLGISKIATSPAEALFEIITPWITEHGELPIYLSGMVGSNIGWIETPYISCPTDITKFRHAQTHISYQDHDIYIAGGVDCNNTLGSPDVMRGEETQIFGAIALYDDLKIGNHLLCLPGTHTKWVSLQDGQITQFHTAITGELYDLLSQHSVLIKGHNTATSHDGFAKGIARSIEIEDTDLLHSLFEVRSKQIKGQLSPDEAASYLSGLIIGKDVIGSLAMFQHHIDADNPITIIGSPRLTEAYRIALRTAGKTAIERDGSATVLAGLKAMFKGS